MYELIVLVFFGGLLFWLWMISDCVYHESKSFDKSIWLAIIFLMNVTGAFAYLALRYRANRKRTTVPETVNDNEK